MKISPDTLSTDSRVNAGALFSAQSGHVSETETLEDFGFGHFAFGHFSMDTAPLDTGKTGITISRQAIAGSASTYEPSSESVELIFDIDGQLETVRDIPRGYDAQWSIGRIADALLPKRREAKKADIALKTALLVRSALQLIDKQQSLDK